MKNSTLSKLALPALVSCLTVFLGSCVVLKSGYDYKFSVNTSGRENFLDCQVANTDTGLSFTNFAVSQETNSESQVWEHIKLSRTVGLNAGNSYILRNKLLPACCLAIDTTGGKKQVMYVTEAEARKNANAQWILVELKNNRYAITNVINGLNMLGIKKDNVGLEISPYSTDLNSWAMYPVKSDSMWYESLMNKGKYQINGKIETSNTESPAPELTIPGRPMTGKTMFSDRYPADANGAIGKDHIVEVNNAGMYIYNKPREVSFGPITQMGVPKKLTYQTLLNWWRMGDKELKKEIKDVYDPVVLYDKFADRFIMVSMTGSEGGDVPNALLIGTTKTGDPTQDWACQIIRMEDDLGLQNTAIDRPRLAFSGNKIVVAGVRVNTNSGNASESIVLVFDKYKLYNPPYDLDFNLFKYQGGPYCPLVTIDNDTSLYIITNPGGSRGTSEVEYYSVTGNSTDNYQIKMRGEESIDGWNGHGGDGVFAHQKGGDVLIDAGDTKSFNGVCRDNKIWFVHTVFLPTDSSVVTTCAIHWAQVDLSKPSARVGYSGFLYQESGYATIAVNKNHDMLIGFTSFSKYTHPSASYILMKNDTAYQPYTYKKGEVYFEYKKGKASDPIRWGDYSATIVDPDDDLSFYTLQQYSRSNRNLLGLKCAAYWAKVKP